MVAMERRPSSFPVLLRALTLTSIFLCTATASAQDGLPLDLFNQGSNGIDGVDGFGEVASLQVTTTLTAEKAEIGATAVLAVQVVLPDGYYIYSTDPGFGGAASIKVPDIAGLEPIDGGFLADRDPKRIFDPNFDQEVEKFYADVTWFRRYKITSTEGLDQLTLKGTLEGQYCNEDPDDGRCIPIRPPHEFSATLAQGEPPETIAGLLQRSERKPLESTTRPMLFNGEPAPIEFTFRLSPVEGSTDDTLQLEITAKLEENWHIFALTQDPLMAGNPTEIDIDPYGLEIVDKSPVPERKPETENPLDDITQEVHYGTITWKQRLRILPGTPDGQWGVSGSVLFQICEEGKCLPPNSADFALGQTGKALTPAAADSALSGSTETASTDDEAGTVEGESPSDRGLIPFLVIAVLSGFGALLTPCVFPMVPITVSLFLKQSEKEHHRPVWTASIYCGGIILSFTFLGVLMAALFGGTSLTQAANNPWLNVFIAGVLVFFGMNLLGMFEIRIPSWLLSWSAGKEGQGGILGVLFMSFTFTLVSFTCTFAFAGTLIVLAANGEYYWPVLGMLAFSTAFATPFFFLALFPSMLQKLPKSGGWMNSVKVTMGMIEMGAALKFLSVADLSWNPNPVIFDFSFTMSAWIIILACLGLYLLGMFRLAHDTAVENISVLRFSIAMFFLTFGAYMAVGLIGREEPKGFVWEQIRVFAPPTLEGGVEQDLGPFVEHDGLKYALDFDKATEYASAQKLPLFLDFTGVNCVNCRKMEKKMAEESNKQLLSKFVRVQLYTDNIPSITDKNEVERLLDRNRTLQVDWFKDVTLPAYAVVTPEGDIILASFKGLEKEEGQFASFLSDGLKKWRAKQSGRTAANTAIVKAGSETESLR